MEIEFKYFAAGREFMISATADVSYTKLENLQIGVHELNTSTPPNYNTLSPAEILETMDYENIQNIAERKISEAFENREEG